MLIEDVHSIGVDRKEESVKIRFEGSLNPELDERAVSVWITHTQAVDLAREILKNTGEIIAR